MLSTISNCTSSVRVHRPTATQPVTPHVIKRFPFNSNKTTHYSPSSTTYCQALFAFYNYYPITAQNVATAMPKDIPPFEQKSDASSLANLAEQYKPTTFPIEQMDVTIVTTANQISTVSSTNSTPLPQNNTVAPPSKKVSSSAPVKKLPGWGYYDLPPNFTSICVHLELKKYHNSLTTFRKKVTSNGDKDNLTQAIKLVDQALQEIRGGNKTKPEVTVFWRSLVAVDPNFTNKTKAKEALSKIVNLCDQIQQQLKQITNIENKKELQELQELQDNANSIKEKTLVSLDHFLVRWGDRPPRADVAKPFGYRTSTIF